jgi:hypothetical protein
MVWLSLSLAPLVAAVQVGVGYAMAKPACASGSIVSLVLLSSVLALGTVAGGYAGWRTRGRFLGTLGLALNALVLVLVIASTLAVAVKPPCE